MKCFFFNLLIFLENNEFTKNIDLFFAFYIMCYFRQYMVGSTIKVVYNVLRSAIMGFNLNLKNI